jgi:nucleoside-diphosphate-sugar epimerase
VFSTQKARDVLGFEPEIDFRRGATDTAEWYRSQGLLRSGAANAVARSEAV